MCEYLICDHHSRFHNLRARVLRHLLPIAFNCFRCSAPATADGADGNRSEGGVDGVDDVDDGDIYRLTNSSRFFAVETPGIRTRAWLEAMTRHRLAAGVSSERGTIYARDVPVEVFADIADDEDVDGSETAFQIESVEAADVVEADSNERQRTTEPILAGLDFDTVRVVLLALDVLLLAYRVVRVGGDVKKICAGTSQTIDLSLSETKSTNASKLTSGVGRSSTARGEEPKSRRLDDRRTADDGLDGVVEVRNNGVTLCRREDSAVDGADDRSRDPRFVGKYAPIAEPASNHLPPVPPLLSTRDEKIFADSRKTGRKVESSSFDSESWPHPPADFGRVDNDRSPTAICRTYFRFLCRSEVFSKLAVAGALCLLLELTSRAVVVYLTPEVLLTAAGLSSLTRSLLGDIANLNVFLRQHSARCNDELVRVQSALSGFELKQLLALLKYFDAGTCKSSTFCLPHQS